MVIKVTPPDGESVLNLLSPVLPAPTWAVETLRERGLARPCPLPAPRSCRSRRVWSQFGGHQLARWEYSFRKKVVISFSAEEKLFRVGEQAHFSAEVASISL